MDKEMNFTIITEDGQEVMCDVLSFYQDTKTEDVFVLYTDYTLDDNDKFKVYLSQLIEERGEYKLELVNDKERYKELASNAKTLYGQPLKELA